MSAAGKKRDTDDAATGTTAGTAMGQSNGCECSKRCGAHASGSDPITCCAVNESHEWPPRADGSSRQDRRCRRRRGKERNADVQDAEQSTERNKQRQKSDRQHNECTQV